MEREKEGGRGREAETKKGENKRVGERGEPVAHPEVPPDPPFLSPLTFLPLFLVSEGH